MSEQIFIMTAFGMTVVTHIVATVWWASKVNTTLQIVVQDVSLLVVELKSMKDTYVTQKEFIKAVNDGDKHRDAMWKRLDEIRDRYETN